ncbi:endonuclease/exonuclease/phosphatase family protein [Geomesophilobacter sediminis]|uniref:Endonuclease/exonuclease/phosphatase family protein n=1 Tax=Geomesophilobacter sediminis TaxID=2798584 RepID=A0A8J7J966_9BACT|nr:endonuclease/exonuclease/phosphatase family protein [Geomesophilobacter sediminis]MBJ6726341.1 endonuclease/exonuclease/phosphatase family protein [Geomesophilobacter sediminis]
MPAAKHILLLLTLIYAILLVGGTILNRLGPDRWWFGAVNLYLPQVIWLIPGILLLVLYLFLAPRLIWVPLLCVVWVLGPVMGFCWPLGTGSATAAAKPFRVMTWNAKYGMREKIRTLELMRELEWNNPDLVLFQDAGGATLPQSPLMPLFNGWYLRSVGQYVIASRHPLSEVREMPLFAPKEKHLCLRCETEVGGRKLVIYNVHLQTPREGLNAFGAVRRTPEFLPFAISRLQLNVRIRLSQAETVARYVAQETDPVLLAGDLNSPDPSFSCMLLRNVGLHDAFAQAGKGYGYTYGHFLLNRRLPWLNYSWMRLDHVMTSHQLQAIRCWTGTKDASDHRPVIADLVWSAK